MDVSIKTPSNIFIVGPSQSGKTILAFKLLENVENMMSPQPTRLIYCYSEFQDIFNHYPNIEFHEGLPDLNSFVGNREPIVIVLDDFMSQISQQMSDLFTRMSHHRNISVVFLTQNIFYKDKHTRTMSLNTHYLFILKNPRDVLQITTLARQMFNKNSKYMLEAFGDAVRRNYGYLFVDLKTNIDDRLRLRTNIFPDEAPQIAYVPK